MYQNMSSKVNNSISEQTFRTGKQTKISVASAYILCLNVVIHKLYIASKISTNLNNFSWRIHIYEIQRPLSMHSSKDVWGIKSVIDLKDGWILDKPKKYVPLKDVPVYFIYIHYSGEKSKESDSFFKFEIIEFKLQKQLTVSNTHAVIEINFTEKPFLPWNNGQKYSIQSICPLLIFCFNKAFYWSDWNFYLQH